MRPLKYIVYLFRLFVFCELYLRVAYFMAFENSTLSSVLIPIPFALILSLVALAPVFFVTVSYIVVLFFCDYKKEHTAVFCLLLFSLTDFLLGIIFFRALSSPSVLLFFCVIFGVSILETLLYLLWRIFYEKFPKLKLEI